MSVCASALDACPSSRQAQRGTCPLTLEATGTGSTKAKDIALHNKDTANGEIIDKIIELWNKMLEADAEHDDKICSNVATMQRRADDAVEILREKLNRLHAIALSAVASAGGIAANEADLLASLSKERLARADLQAQLDRLQVKHEKCLDLIPALRRQIKETKDALELDTPKLLEIKNTVQTETSDRQEKLKARVKLGAGACPKGGALPVPAASGGKNGLEFGAMDLDGDGVVSKAEFKSKLSIMGWSLEEAEQTFKAMDRDGDGGISSNEYAAFCQMDDKNLEFGHTSRGLWHHVAHVLHYPPAPRAQLCTCPAVINKHAYL